MTHNCEKSRNSSADHSSAHDKRSYNNGNSRLQKVKEKNRNGGLRTIGTKRICCACISAAKGADILFIFLLGNDDEPDDEGIKLQKIYDEIFDQN